MNRTDSLAYAETEYIPRPLAPHILYHSPRFRLAIHLCACGCGIETVTPIGEQGWSIDVVDGRVTLAPSIGNMQLPCGSHYWVRDGRIEWA